MTVRCRRLAGATTASLLVLAGCGQGGGAGTAGAGDAGPITSRAVAAVALEHLPEDTSSRQATYVDRTDPAGRSGPTCATTRARCAERGGARVAASYAGAAITGDPRRMPDLEPSVEVLRSIVTDDRLAPRASASTLAAGRDLARWDGGHREQGELDEVAQTAPGLVGTFMLGRGGRWSYEGPSPVADDLGDGAVAGRLRTAYADGPIGPGVLDVAAVPSMPRWAEAETCREGWSCWARGGTRVVWRPAQGEDPGESWLLKPSGLGGVAGLHVADGRRIPADPGQIRYLSGFVLYGRYLTDPVEPQAIGTTTDRKSLERAEALAAEHEAG